MCFIAETSCFLVVYQYFAIKTKKIQHTILKIFNEKNLLQNLRFQYGIFDLKIQETFITACSLKNYYLKLNFHVLQSASFKNKNILKKYAWHLRIAWHCKRQHKNIGRKTKNEKKSINNTKYFLLLLFYMENFIFCYITYLEKLCLYCYTCIFDQRSYRKALIL